MELIRDVYTYLFMKIPITVLCIIVNTDNSQNQNQGRECSSVLESVFSMCKTLGSTLSTKIKQKPQNQIGRK
jgi:hypothetical protein